VKDASAHWITLREEKGRRKSPSIPHEVGWCDLWDSVIQYSGPSLHSTGVYTILVQEERLKMITKTKEERVVVMGLLVQMGYMKKGQIELLCLHCDNKNVWLFQVELKLTNVLSVFIFSVTSTQRRIFRWAYLYESKNWDFLLHN